MICFVCRKEIVGAFIKCDKTKRCRHIECLQKIVRASSETIAVPKNVRKCRTDLIIDNPDDILNENILGEMNE